MPWVAPAAVAVDWRIPAPLIGERKDPLEEATLARIEAGLRRYGFLPELVPTERTSRNGQLERSGGKIRADVVHDRLAAMGYGFGPPRGRAWHGDDRQSRPSVTTLTDVYGSEPRGPAVWAGYRSRTA
jgi:hypothetical protein